MVLQLSKRLMAVASLVMQHGVVADIGTDHGYIPIYLIQQEKMDKAIAMDVNKGPLLRASEHISQYGLSRYIETRLSDGLSAVKPGEADSIVIAGMGGELMMQILARGETVAKMAKELILQPQSELGAFRKFLDWKGYRIYEEDMVFEDGKFYPMMRAGFQLESAPGQLLAKTENEKRLAYEYGGLLLEMRHPVLKQYLIGQMRQKQVILEQIKEQQGSKIQQRRAQIQTDLADIIHVLSKYDRNKSIGEDGI